MAGETHATHRGPIQYCELCSKPFTNVSSYKRHVSYCRRAQSQTKRRQRSCRACGQAKAKCSFDTPCSRCASRDIDCVYDHAQTRAVIPASSDTNVSLPESMWMVDQSHGISIDADLHAMNFSWTNSDVPLGASASQQQLIPPSPRTNRMALSSALSQIQNFSFVDPITDMLLSTHSDIGTLNRNHVRDPVTARNSYLILQTLRTFPEKMLNRNDLPFFIHPHWHRDALPEPLAICMRICQMFSTRTPDVHGFIWRCIRTEQLRYLADDFTRDEMLAACQAQVMYVMMFVIEEGMRRIEWVRELLMLSGAVCQRLIMLCEYLGGHFCQDEISYPSANWDDWVFAESRRRTACVWFLMSLVFSLQTGIHCSVLEDFRILPLPSAKLQWEAPNALSWQQRYGLSDFNSLSTIGSLIDVHSLCAEPEFAQKLDSWNAKTDQLGFLLNLAVDML